MSVNDRLLEILACPACKAKVEYSSPSPEEEWIVCTKCRRQYPVREGIPIMLVSEAAGGETEEKGDEQGS